MLFVSNISKAYSSRTLFSGLNFVVAAGDRIALIGPNGSGKTTLMDILSGDASSDSGSISRQRGVTAGYLKQEPALFGGKSLLQEVLDASPDAAALTHSVTATREALATEPDPEEQAALMQRLGRLEMELEAAGGVTETTRPRPSSPALASRRGTFSPHGRVQWRLGHAGRPRAPAVQGPRSLLLDEPTNHLDLDANLWFENTSPRSRVG